VSTPHAGRFAVPVVCLDGPLAGARTTVAGDAETVVLHDANGDEHTYRIDGPLSTFPGHTMAATYVPPD
jgi:hypothetical protein